MSHISELIQGNTEYLLLTLIVIAVGILLTLVVGMTARNLRFMKYIPGLVLIFGGVFSLFTVLGDLFAKSSLDNLLIAMLGISSGIIALLFGLILGILTKKS